MNRLWYRHDWPVSLTLWYDIRDWGIGISISKFQWANEIHLAIPFGPFSVDIMWPNSRGEG